jgi:hypothetical protein
MNTETTNTVTQEQIDEIISKSLATVSTEFNKCTVVTVQLPNGFVLVEHSACVDPKNYDEKMGFEICVKRIKDRLWELEGYRLQCELANKT